MYQRRITSKSSKILYNRRCSISYHRIYHNRNHNLFHYNQIKGSRCYSRYYLLSSLSLLTITSLQYPYTYSDYNIINDDSNQIKSNLTTTDAKKQLSLIHLINHYLKLIYNKIKNGILIIVRSGYHFIILSPILAIFPLYSFNLINEEWWWNFLRYCIKCSGSCNTKFAQWIATRPDLFPLVLCQQLQVLQSNATKSSWKHAEQSLKYAFGNDWNKNIYIDMSNDNKTPIVLGSGCVAQVFKGKVNNKSVAIKIIHPDIKEEIEADIRIMKFVTSLIDMIPGLQNLSLSESVEEFQQIMTAQLDLTKEAQNLLLFRSNFNQTKGVTFPEPIYPYISPTALVETYEQGTLVSDMLDYSDPFTKKKLAILGLDAILKMTFLDNFIHADLHPGNIIVRNLDNGNLELSMIDVGIVAKLQPEDRKNFIELFDAVIKNDGKRVGRLMIERSRGKTCLNEEGFMKELDEVVTEVHACGLSLGRIGIGPLLQKVLVACYNHGVKIESRFAIVIIALGISEGLGRRLDPDVDILKRAAPFVLKAAVAGLY